MVSLQPRRLDDLAFHKSVSLQRWERERVLEFVPPDGRFELLNYSAGGVNELPVEVSASLTFPTRPIDQRRPNADPPGDESALGSARAQGARDSDGAAQVYKCETTRTFLRKPLLRKPSSKTVSETAVAARV